MDIHLLDLQSTHVRQKSAEVEYGYRRHHQPFVKVCFLLLKSLRLSRFCLEFILDTSSLLIIQLIDIAIYQTTIKTYYTVLWQSSMRSSILQYVVHVVEQACSQYCSQACSMFIRAYISTPVDKLPFCPLLKFLADIKM